MVNLGKEKGGGGDVAEGIGNTRTLADGKDRNSDSLLLLRFQLIIERNPSTPLHPTSHLRSACPIGFPLSLLSISLNY